MDIFKITADDFGYCKQRNRGIIELVKLNVVKNISVLVNGIYAVKIDLDKDVHIGLHFNITEGLPISKSENVTPYLIIRQEEYVYIRGVA